MALSGTLEAEVELKSSAETYFKIWRSEINKMPTITSENVQGVSLHEGDWHTHGAIKLWEYTVNGKTEVFKEKVEFDEENLTFKLHGIEGDVFLQYKVFKPSCKVIPKEEGAGAVAKLYIEYEKTNENDPNPDIYMDFFKTLTKDTDAHVSTEA